MKKILFTLLKIFITSRKIIKKSTLAFYDINLLQNPSKFNLIKLNFSLNSKEIENFYILNYIHKSTCLNKINLILVRFFNNYTLLREDFLKIFLRLIKLKKIFLNFMILILLKLFFYLLDFFNF